MQILAMQRRMAAMYKSCIILPDQKKKPKKQTLNLPLAHKGILQVLKTK